MVLLHTPVCEFDTSAIDFALKDSQGKLFHLADCRGPKGLLVMFICNHCPYVKAILPDLVEDTRHLINQGIGCVAIMANDYEEYPEDAPECMAERAQKFDFPFPYLIDATQETAKAYGAVCTPDFFGYNQDLKLQYRGRFAGDGKRELLMAMQHIAQTGQGPRDQIPSMGCSIKWK
ncbi:MAG: thioredoxin family protein [Gammaproteobacteria bacterium]